MAEQRAEREEILARRPRPMQVKLQRARAPERLAATYSSPCNRDGRARGFPKAQFPRAQSRRRVVLHRHSAAGKLSDPCRARGCDTFRVGLHCLAASPLQSGDCNRMLPDTRVRNVPGSGA